jgi:predicted membrane channel-forming protein YqfA (hemolysin III family)
VITHGLGLALSVAGLVVLYVAGTRGGRWVLVSTAIYGATLVVLHAGATLYRCPACPDGGASRRLRSILRTPS